MRELQLKDLVGYINYKAFYDICEKIDKSLDDIKKSKDASFYFLPELRYDSFSHPSFSILYFTGEICIQGKDEFGYVPSYNPYRTAEKVYNILDAMCKKYKMGIKERSRYYVGNCYYIKFSIYYDIKEI